MVDNQTCGKLNWNPNFWNTLHDTNEDYHDHSNCYAYAFNKINNAHDGDYYKGNDFFKKLQPGTLSGGKYEKYGCDEIVSKMKRDWGWYSIEECKIDDKLPCNRYKIALVIDNKGKHTDYHFYRQDSNGYWSHKMGGNRVNNKDCDDKLIKDPKEACRNYDETNNDKYNYEIFCGYYSVPYVSNNPINIFN